MGVVWTVLGKESNILLRNYEQHSYCITWVERFNRNHRTVHNAVK